MQAALCGATPSHGHTLAPPTTHLASGLIEDLPLLDNGADRAADRIIMGRCPVCQVLRTLHTHVIRQGTLHGSLEGCRVCSQQAECVAVW